MSESSENFPRPRKRKPTVKKQKSYSSEVARYNLHQNMKSTSAQATAEQINISLEEAKRENKKHSVSNLKPNYEITETKKTATTPVAAQLIQLGRTHYDRVETPIPLPPREEKLVYTSSSSPKILLQRLRRKAEEEKKRTSSDIYPAPKNSQSKRQRVPTFASFAESTAVKSFEDIFGNNISYYSNPPHRSSKLPLSRIPTNVSARHIENILWQPWHEEFVQCCCSKTKTCKSVNESKLRHPLKPDIACMAQMSSVQYEAFSKQEPISPLASHGDQFFKNNICVFCYRYHLTQLLTDDSTMSGSSITYEIPDYYHQVDVEGEYKSSVCFQNQGGNCRGVNGNVVLYDANTYVPVVGVISQTNPREIERVLDMEEYFAEKDNLANVALAYGWRERGVFFKQNNNTVPECAEINPLSYTYTRLKEGALTIRVVLKGYFSTRTDTQKYNLLDEFETMLSNFTTLWSQPHPMTEPNRIEYYECNDQQIRDDSSDVWERYHVWQNVCLHVASNPPRRSSSKIYYTFLYIINGLLELKNSNKKFPIDISKKLKRYINSFSKFQEYYRNCGGDFSDLRVKTFRTQDIELELDCSYYFSCYPRTKKLGFTVHEYAYLTFETVTLRVLSPEKELAQLYSNPSVLHDETTLFRETQIEGVLNALLKSYSGPYHSATSFYNQCLTLLREPVVFFDWLKERNMSWPKNQLIQFNKNREREKLRIDDESHAPEFEEVAAGMITIMERILRKIFKLLRLENFNYNRFVGLLHYALVPFLELRETIKVRSVVAIFNEIGNPDLSYLLPEGYIADVNGINFLEWKDNTALLTALVRVHILERLITLENVVNNRKRHLLTMLRNSHIDLVKVICELPSSIPFHRNDAWLRYRPIMEPAGFISHESTSYRPSIDTLTANLPYSSLVFHEGRLPNLSSTLLHTNYFSDDAEKYMNMVFKHKTTMTPIIGKQTKTIFSNDAVRHCNKITIAKLSKKKNVSAIIDSIDFGLIVPKRLLILQLMKCSFLGMYEHATIKPSFRISCQLSNVFENADTQDVRDLFDHFVNHTVIGEKGKKLKFEKIMNDVYLEYLHRLHSDTPIQNTLLKIYGVDPARKSLILMDFVRLGISQNSLSLHLLFEMRQKNPVKLSTKIVNEFCMSSIDRICQVILKSDEPRYASSFKKKAHLPSEYQIQRSEKVIVHRFIRKLKPTGTIFAEELVAIKLEPDTLKLLSQIHAVVSQTKYDIQEAVKLFESMEVRQASIVAYFFNTLQAYLVYGEVVVRNRDFVERQEKVLKKVAGIAKSETVYRLPEAIYKTVISMCCNTWNGVSSNSQYYKQEYTGGDRKHFLMPHGNQSVVIDWITGEVYCKANRKPSKKKKGNARAVPVPPPKEESEFFTVTSKYIENSRIHGTEPKRLNKIRIVEKRLPTCGEIPSLEVNLRSGRILTVNKKIRHAFLKRKTSQFQERKNRGSKDPASLYQPFKSLPLMMSNPPYVLSPCCGSIRGTGPHCWGINGYYCGACLPRSNIEMSLLYEILCFSCRKVVGNNSASRCPIPSCPVNELLEPFYEYWKPDLVCKHGASPVYIVDDVAGKPVHAYFCETCYKNFDSCEPALVTISAVKKQDFTTAAHIVEGKDLGFQPKRKPMNE